MGYVEKCFFKNVGILITSVLQTLVSSADPIHLCVDLIFFSLVLFMRPLPQDFVQVDQLFHSVQQSQGATIHARSSRSDPVQVETPGQIRDRVSIPESQVTTVRF